MATNNLILTGLILTLPFWAYQLYIFGIDYFIQSMIDYPIWLLIFPLSGALYGFGFAAALGDKIGNTSAFITAAVMLLNGAYGIWETQKRYDDKEPDTRYILSWMHIIGWIIAGVGLIMYATAKDPEPTPVETCRNETQEFLTQKALTQRGYKVIEV